MLTDNERKLLIAVLSGDLGNEEESTEPELFRDENDSSTFSLASGKGLDLSKYHYSYGDGGSTKVLQ